MTPIPFPTRNRLLRHSPFLCWKLELHPSSSYPPLLDTFVSFPLDSCKRLLKLFLSKAFEVMVFGSLLRRTKFPCLFFKNNFFVTGCTCFNSLRGTGKGFDMLRLGGIEAYELTKRLPLLLELRRFWTVPGLLALLTPRNSNLLPKTFYPIILGGL